MCKLKSTFNNTKLVPHKAHQPTSNNFVLKADTGASQHYIKYTDKKYLTNYSVIKTNQTIMLPNGTQIPSTVQGHLPLPQSLNQSTTLAKVLPALRNTSLLSIGQLCDDHCIAIFQKNKFDVIKNNKIVLTGPRNFQDGLWDTN